METIYKLDIFTVVLIGRGQEEIYIGDEFIVDVYFITDPKVAPFGHRIEKIFMERFAEDWGNLPISRNFFPRHLEERYNDGKNKFRHTYFTGKTWKEAKQKAAEYCRDQAKIVMDAIAKREKALKEAGEWE